VKVPPDQSLASRSVVTSEGKASNGSPKPDGIKGVGSVLNSEKCIVVVLQDNPVYRESRRDECSGRQQSCMRYGEYSGHHRGLRPGHVLKGVARELGRSKCFLVKYRAFDGTIRFTGAG